MDASTREADKATGLEDTDESAHGSRRRASQLPNEKLLLLVKDFALASRLLTVRIYQVCQDVDTFVGLRVAATDDVENDYALFISRAKGEQLHHTQKHAADPPPSPEAIASSVLSRLDIVGNRHRDVGRLTCRVPDVATHVDHKPRAAPQLSSSSASSSKPRSVHHFPTKAEDKRTSRNRQSQQRAMDAIAASHRHPHEEAPPSPVVDPHAMAETLTDASSSKTKASRKSSEMSLLHRMANANATIVWRTELEGIDDAAVVEFDDDDEQDEPEVGDKPVEPPATLSRATQHAKRALPDRKPKYSELQRRRDKERKQRLQLVRPLARSPSSSAVGTDHSVPPPRQASPHRQSAVSSSSSRYRPSSPATATSTAAHPTAAIKMIVSGTPPEAEQFLRRKTIVENQNRVFKAEGVFDDTMGVEITHERPDHRFHTPEHAPPSPEPTTLMATKRTASTTKNRRPRAAGGEGADTSKRPLSSTKSAPVLPSPRDVVVEEFEEVSPAPIANVSNRLVLEALRNEPNANALAQDEDATMEIMSVAAEATLVSMENPLVVTTAEGEEVPGGVMLATPRSARTVGAVEMHQEVHDEHDETEDAHEDEMIHSARVECWEEVEKAIEERSEVFVDPELDDSAREPIDKAAQQWAAPLEQPPFDGDPIEEPNEPLPEDVPVEEAGHVDVDVPQAIPPGDEPIDDPIVEVESPPPLQPSKEKPSPPHSASSSPLRRGVVGGATAPRRGSIMDAAASAIAMAAAAAAVAAAAIPPVESAQEPPTARTNPQHELKLTSRKRRSHDATPSQSVRRQPAESRRDGPRRSTIHFFHMTEDARAFVVGAGANAADQSDVALANEMVSRPPDRADAEPTIRTPSSTVSVSSVETEQKTPPPSTPNQHHHRHRSQQELALLQQSPSYHTKWNKWTTGKQLLDKVSCLQLEEQLLIDPTNAMTLVKLGLRYARWPATSLAAVLLLENEAVVHDDGASAHPHAYWNALGNAHFDVFVRHRKFLPVAIFHLSKSVQALTRAFAYLESVADPLLLLRYAVCMYWKRSDDGSTTHLEHADDIVRELWSKFASFCDKDRINVLFFHFQILSRLKTWSEAIECLHKILAIHETSALEAASPATRPSSLHGGAPPPYDTSDYLLMLMHCQQASGDFLQASTTFSQLLKTLHATHSGPAEGSTWSDHEYLHLWGALADKCFSHEDYALAIELYAITATYAKDSRVLARVLYHHALCFHTLGDGTTCSAEFKRANNVNRHVVPFATLAEIHARYDGTYTALLRTPVARIIDDVRQNLYDRAVTSLQRLFRRKQRRGGSDHRDVRTVDESKTTARSLDRHRVSVVASLTSLVEASGNRKASRLPAGVTQGRRSAAIIDPHEAFVYRQTIALQKLAQIRGRPLKRTASMCVVSPTKTLALVATQSGLLSPVADRPDLRRKHSMDSLATRLGYLPANGEAFTGYWTQLVATSLDLYETQTAFHRHVAHIRSVLPLAADAVACCALADAMGNVDCALERLHDTTYEQELQLVSTVVDISTIVQRHFASLHESTPSQRTRFPPIQSPVKSSSSMSIRQDSLSPTCKPQPRQLSLPPCKSSPRTSSKAVRLASLIDAQFEDAGRARLADDMKDDAVGSQRLREMDQFTVIEDFRAVNVSLLHGWQRS